MKKTVYRFRLTALAVLAVLVLAMVFSACENPSGDGGGGNNDGGGGSSTGDPPPENPPPGNPALTGLVSAGSEGGTPQVGLAITANTSGLNGTGAFTYQWQRGEAEDGAFTNIDDATEASYTPVIGDVETYIRIVVSRAGYSGTKTSAAVGPVRRAGVTNLVATVSNDNKVTLTWTNPPDTDLSSVKLRYERAGILEGSHSGTGTHSPNTETRTFQGLAQGLAHTFIVTTWYEGDIEGGTASVVAATPLTDTDFLAGYFGYAPGGTADAPVSLPVRLNLSTDWAALLSAIQNKYVALDLSACTMSGTEFDPGAGTIGVDKIVSLVLPDAAISIKAGNSSSPTFRHFTALTSVSGNNIVTVGTYAFKDCPQLATVSLPVATTINNAFKDCPQLATVSIPNATTIIDYAFQNCTQLTSVSLPEATTIGGYAFSGCTQLTSVSLLKATTIGGYAFSGCTQLTSVSLPEATTIGGYAFSGCTQLASVSLLNATTFGDYAFSGCTQLATVSLPEAKYIYSYAFEYCTQLATVSLPKATTFSDYVFSGCTQLASVSLLKAYQIGNSAFQNCTQLASVSLPEAVIIGVGVFSGCTKLASVSIPKVGTISNKVFELTGGRALTVTLGSTFPTILGYGMFLNISVAKTVTVKVPNVSAWTNITGNTYNQTSNYTVNWGNGFRGGGWTSSGTFDGGTVNNNITLTVTTIP